MADWKEIFGIDLDVKDATQKALELKGQIQSIGDSKNLDGLISGLTKVGAVAAVVGGSFYAVKKALDFSIEAENIRSVEKQFELLSAQAGISGEKLSEGLKKAAKGLIGETELLEIANKAIINLGSSTERLPELLEIAGKVATVTGKDIKETFETLSHVISTGNTRALRGLNIVVDQEQAYRRYAKSIGEATDSLTEQAKRQAMLNEVILSASGRLDAVDTDVKATTKAWKTLGLVIQDTKEAIAIAFDSVFGDKLKSGIDSLKAIASSFKTTINAEFGTGTKQLEAQIERVKEEIKRTDKALAEAKANADRGTIARMIFGDPEEQAKKLEEYGNNLRTSVAQMAAKLQEERKKAEESARPAVEAPLGGKDDLVDADKKRLIESQLAKDLITIQNQVLAARQQSYLTQQQFEDLARQRELALEQEREQKKLELRAREIQENIILKDQIAAVDQLYDERRKQLQIQLAEELLSVEQTTIERRIALNQNAWDRFALGAKKASADARRSLSDFAAFGQSSVNTLSNAFASAFEQVGQGGISLGEALRKSMVGAIADIAAAKGRELIASSIFPPNPLGLAAGAGLLALSGVLRSSVGAPASVPATASSGASAGNVERAAVERTPIAPDPEQFDAQRRKSVVINIQGSYFDTDETRMRLTQMIRENADATDFKILSVGGGV